MFLLWQTKIENQHFFICSYGSENRQIKKTSKTVKQVLLNFLKDGNKLEELGIDVTADTVTDP